MDCTWLLQKGPLECGRNALWILRTRNISLSAMFLTGARVSRVESNWRATRRDPLSFLIPIRRHSIERHRAPILSPMAKGLIGDYHKDRA